MQCSRSSNFLSDLEDKSILFYLFSTISSLTLVSDNRASNTLNFLCGDDIGTFLQHSSEWTDHWNGFFVLVDGRSRMTKTLNSQSYPKTSEHRENGGWIKTVCDIFVQGLMMWSACKLQDWKGFWVNSREEEKALLHET